MGLMIYNEKKNVEPKEMFLRLVDDGDRILLTAVYENGEKVHCGNLFAFHKDGTVERCCSVNPYIGFKLNEKSQLAFEDDMKPVAPSLDERIYALLREGKKFDAIKLHCAENGSSLVEAKTHIELLEA